MNNKRTLLTVRKRHQVGKSGAKQVSFFERTIGLGTILIGLAGLIAAGTQIFIQYEQYRIDYAGHKPNIIAVNEYWPPANIQMGYKRPPNHTVRFHADMKSTREISIHRHAIVDVKISKVGFGTKTFSLPFPGYFDFCSAIIKPDETQFSWCHGEGNYQIETGIREKLSKEYNIQDSHPIQSVSVKQVYRFRYVDFVGRTHNDFMLVDDFGTTKSQKAELEFKRARDNVSNFRIIRNDHSASEIIQQIKDAYSTELPI